MSTVTRTSLDEHKQVQLQEQPAFIVGAVRSGTTLLRLMLDHHPELAFHFEFEFAVDQVAADGSFPSLKQYHDYLSQHRVFQLSEGVIDPSLSFQELVNSFLEQKRLRDNKLFVGATVHHHIDRIQHLWPEAKYIHLLRDGRDVARSCKMMGWAGNMYHAVDRWIDAELTWKRLRKHISKEHQLEVRYEDLIREPEQTLSQICQFLGVEFDEQIYDYASTSTYDMPDASLIAQWRNKLADEEVQLAEARISEMLVERGYELSGLPLKEVTPAEQKRLAMQDRLWRARFRMRRYGLPLFATDFVARRLPLDGLARRCKDKINTIDNQHIR